MTLQNAAPLRLGVLGCANIARQFVRDVMGSDAVSIVAAASRNAETAASFANAFGIARAYGSYELLLADPEVDAIYLPLPNSLHAEWAIKAAESGKHVLCEKPLAMSLQEARRMFESANASKVILLEAYPYFFQPQTQSMRRLLEEGAVGSVRSVQASFGFALTKPEGNIRMKPELGGGALLDAGSYALSAIRLVMGCRPSHVMADATWAETGVDISAMATLYYADGRRAQLSCAMDTANHRHLLVAGSAGTLESEYLNHTGEEGVPHPLGFLPSTLRIRRGTANTIPFETIQSKTGSGFRFAAEAFAAMVAVGDHRAAEVAAEASLDNAATLEAIGKSAHSLKRVEVGA